MKILGGGIWSPETDIEWGIWMAFNPWEKFKCPGRIIKLRFDWYIKVA